MRLYRFKNALHTGDIFINPSMIVSMSPDKNYPDFKTMILVVTGVVYSVEGLCIELHKILTEE